VNGEQVAAVVAGWRGHAPEAAVQEHLAGVLAAAGGRVRREVAVAGGRVDLVVDRVGVEVKVAGTVAEVARQVIRYCADPGLDAVVVATTRAAHLGLPRAAHGKPVIVVHLAGVV